MNIEYLREFEMTLMLFSGAWVNMTLENNRKQKFRDNVPLMCTLHFPALLCTVLQCPECQQLVSLYSIMLYPYSGFDERDDWQVVKSIRRRWDMSLLQQFAFS
jgi:hypothetical protein